MADPIKIGKVMKISFVYSQVQPFTPKNYPFTPNAKVTDFRSL